MYGGGLLCPLYPLLNGASGPEFDARNAATLPPMNQLQNLTDVFIGHSEKIFKSDTLSLLSRR